MNIGITSSFTLQDDKRELENCIFIKTVLMIIVVLYHSIVFWHGGWLPAIEPKQSSIYLDILSQWLNSFHIYGFTFISGYIFYYLRVETKKYRSFSEFFIKKLKRLLIPYAFSCIWVISAYCIFNEATVVDLLKKYALGTSPSQLWFLLMLFGVYMIFWLLSDYFSKYFLVGAFTVCVLYGVGLVGNGLFPNYFQIWTVCRYILFFWLGFVIRRYGGRIIMRINPLIYFIVDIALFAIVCVFPENNMLQKVLKYGISVFLNIVGTLMAFVVLQRLAIKTKWKESIFFTFLTKRSMTVYLLHQQIIYFTLFLLNGRINPYLNAVINFAVSLGLSLIISSVFLKFKVTAFLVGERKEI